MAFRRIPSFVLPLLLITMSLMSYNTIVEGSRHLLEVKLPEIPELPKPELPEIPELPKPELPEIPELPKPELPEIPELPPLPKVELPKPELPKLPEIPSLPHDLPKDIPNSP